MFEESIRELLYKFYYAPREYNIDDKSPHDDDIIAQIRIVYILGIIAWLFIIVILRLYDGDTLGTVILLIPLIVFILGYYNADVVTPEVEKEMFTTNYLSVGLIVILPLLIWITDNHSKNKGKFIALVVLAIILTLLSMIDIWVSKRELSVYNHARSILQTLSIIVIIYALYIFYLEKYSVYTSGDINHPKTDKHEKRADDMQIEKDDYCNSHKLSDTYSNLETAAVLATGAAAVDIGTAAAISSFNSE